ncbi:hypothetical protein D8674_036174 [Pyrus ussuriensis x Pyrus communis]|uniref:Uncharacterized protein n=1 Tax=Pyrus ussuriensis x Pyrus communis TaxID=2448454 RepID=A0A5N5GEX9_9ROSA|nr:hypothetical protein D8674_036174 [Pyrus ussuriensis x Pyrus communis]
MFILFLNVKRSPAPSFWKSLDSKILWKGWRVGRRKTRGTVEWERESVHRQEHELISIAEKKSNYDDHDEEGRSGFYLLACNSVCRCGDGLHGLSFSGLQRRS